MNVLVVGLGLIGGSLAKAIKQYTSHKTSGIDSNSDVIKQALIDGSIDQSAEQCSGFDMVLLALYPYSTVDFLEKHVDQFDPDCLVVDTCGVKQFVCDRAKTIFSGKPSHFLGGHPMAGREFSGYQNSIPHLFQNASMILTPDEYFRPEHLAKADSFFSALGFGRITVTTPQHHDQVIAYTSQLAHVVSNAYMQSPTANEFSGFSAGSFADLTRVAKLNPDMWTELFLCNKDALCREIQTMIQTLEQFKQAIGQDHADHLWKLLDTGSKIKEHLNEERERGAHAKDKC